MTNYLGDGVYAYFNGFSIELRTGAHDSPTVVTLESDVLASLNAFAAAVKLAALRNRQPANPENPPESGAAEHDRVSLLARAEWGNAVEAVSPGDRTVIYRDPADGIMRRTTWDDILAGAMRGTPVAVSYGDGG